MNARGPGGRPSMGIMQACLDIVVPHIHDRQQFGKAIGEFQLIQGQSRGHVHHAKRLPSLSIRRRGRL